MIAPTRLSWLFVLCDRYPSFSSIYLLLMYSWVGWWMENGEEDVYRRLSSEGRKISLLRMLVYKRISRHQYLHTHDLVQTVCCSEILWGKKCARAFHPEQKTTMMVQNRQSNNINLFGYTCFTWGDGQTEAPHGTFSSRKPCKLCGRDCMQISAAHSSSENPW